MISKRKKKRILAMLKKPISKREIARAVGVSPQTVCNLSTLKLDSFVLKKYNGEVERLQK